MTAVTGARIVHVEHCMGTAFTIDIRDAGDWTQTIEAAVRWLHHVDAVFSTYKAYSDISRIRRGELTVADADPDVATVLDLCVAAQITTEHRFTAMPHGQLDPTGLVKGWAIERASELLRERGAANHAVNGGGDMQLAGEGGPGQPWTVGISDPADRTRVITAVAGRDLAVATSGTSERGAHIVDPFAPGISGEVTAATVLGPSLTNADAYATAAFVMGRHALRWIEAIDGYELLLVASDGSTHRSRGWHRYAVE